MACDALFLQLVHPIAHSSSVSPSARCASTELPLRSHLIIFFNSPRSVAATMSWGSRDADAFGGEADGAFALAEDGVEADDDIVGVDDADGSAHGLRVA